MRDLFSVAGEEFYFDLDRISEFIKLENKEDDLDALLSKATKNTDPEGDEVETDTETDTDRYGQMIDITKWELTKAMVETVLSEQGVVDEAMGIEKLESQLSIPFRISFNTLLINKILRKHG
jgi:hypothetical protein